jgi:hypothetical protein
LAGLALGGKYHLWLLFLIFLAGTVGDPVLLPQSRSRDVSALDQRAAQQNCESSHPGITYCVEDRGDIHVVIIDLESPDLRFEMVMAEDVTSVDTTRRERIEEMVNRPPYVDQSVLVAINADYFGWSHGPEGLTIKNGQRLDGEGGRQYNPYAVWRSSLAVSRLNQVSLGRKSEAELSAPRAYRQRFYNAAGGGPLILNAGVVIPNRVACTLERFPVGACRRLIQTAAGLSEDGRYLFLAVGEGRDIEGFARLLRDYGAHTAIKMDGGGSSQLWYDGAMRYDSDRAVGNALFVFRSPRARHDARVLDASRLTVAEPGEVFEVTFEIENTGFLDWEPDLGYRFKNVQGWPVIEPAYQRLPQPVPAGTTAQVRLNFVAPQHPGIYEAEWQLAYQTDAMGSRLWFAVVVVPAGSGATGFRQRVASQLVRWHAQAGFEQRWPDLRSELGWEICRQTEAELRKAIRATENDPRLSVASAVPTWWEPLCGPFGW